MSIFKNSTLLITGGTGSFGNAVLSRFWIQILRRYVYSRAMKKNRTICVTRFKQRCRKCLERLNFI